MAYRSQLLVRILDAWPGMMQHLGIDSHMLRWLLSGDFYMFLSTVLDPTGAPVTGGPPI